MSGCLPPLRRNAADAVKASMRRRRTAKRQAATPLGPEVAEHERSPASAGRMPLPHAPCDLTAVAQPAALSRHPLALRPHGRPLSHRQPGLRCPAMAGRARGACARNRAAHGVQAAIDGVLQLVRLAARGGTAARRPQYGASLSSLVSGQRLLTLLRERILVQVQRLDLGYHWRHGVGELVTRTTRDADKLRDALKNSGARSSS
ncbi:ABC transporter transmembrane region domain-containing protein [Ditylenchus destructor]|nr:ABC transporter transmembrane region domain-containing protein [Ditylenchus destructor]